MKPSAKGWSFSLVNCPSAGGAGTPSEVGGQYATPRTWVDVPTIPHTRVWERFVFPYSCVGQIFPRLGDAGYFIGKGTGDQGGIGSLGQRGG